MESQRLGLTWRQALLVLGLGLSLATQGYCQVPGDAPVDVPVDVPVDAPVDVPADAPVDAPVEAPVGPLNCSASPSDPVCIQSCTGLNFNETLCPNCTAEPDLFPLCACIVDPVPAACNCSEPTVFVPVSENSTASNLTFNPWCAPNCLSPLYAADPRCAPLNCSGPARNDPACAVVPFTVVDPAVELAKNLAYIFGFIGLNIVLMVLLVVVVRFVKKKIDAGTFENRKLRDEKGA